MDRRRFLRTSFIFTAGLFVPKTGILRPAEARWPALSVTSSSGPAYRDWDERAEGGLGADQNGDGVDDTLCLFMENPTADGNEEATGAGLTGADATVTRIGSVPGAESQPPYRNPQKAGGFTIPNAMTEKIFCTTGQYTFIAKIKNIVFDECMLLNLGQVGGTSYYLISVYFAYPSSKRVYIREYRNGAEERAFTADNAIPETGEFLYFGFYRDAVNPTRVFVSAEKPLKWADIPDNQKGEAPNRLADWPSGVFTDSYLFQGSYDIDRINGQIYSVVMSNVSLLS